MRYRRELAEAPVFLPEFSAASWVSNCTFYGRVAYVQLTWQLTFTALQHYLTAVLVSF